MTKVKLILLMVCLAGFAFTFGQNKKTIGKNSISANILGTGSYVGVSYERLLFERVSAEVGIGIIGFGTGVTLYPLRKVRAAQLNPFFGIKYTDHAIVDGENKSATYLPIGITYFSKIRMNFSVDIGPSYFRHKSPGYMPTQQEIAKYPYTNFGFWGNLKIGFRF